MPPPHQDRERNAQWNAVRPASSHALPCAQATEGAREHAAPASLLFPKKEWASRRRCGRRVARRRSAPHAQAMRGRTHDGEWEEPRELPADTLHRQPPFAAHLCQAPGCAWTHREIRDFFRAALREWIMCFFAAISMDFMARGRRARASSIFPAATASIVLRIIVFINVRRGVRRSCRARF